MKSTAELRQAFIDFFGEQGHQTVASASLVPQNDPTLLFTNAGMVPFKSVFLGQEQRDYRRAVTAQRCVRAGGKHNDLENVGYTARHHTFFEMLGNFSFGDYFKREAIGYAWSFITEVLGLPPERLWVTVFEEDDEAADIWLKEVGVDPERFSRCGAKDNFWSMGDTGPCGPCSEIFYDHGAEIPGGPPGSADEDGDRYIEIWNLVFMQYDRGTDGKLTPLPKPSVDTGMGLERLAAVMQGVHSNYEIDIFQRLIEAAADVTGSNDLGAKSLRVIADHIRSCAFLVADGVMPSNEGRGYVLRRIIRRAIRHGYQLGQRQPFFHRLVGPLAETMGDAYPELVQASSLIGRVLLLEEERFAETIEQGMKHLEAAIQDLQGGTRLSGDLVFKLYDTYGFPFDLTADIARERNLTLDEEGFSRAMDEQRRRARAASQFDLEQTLAVGDAGESVFCGYRQLTCDSSIGRLLVAGQPVETMKAGDEGVLVLDETPFYAVSGGQVADVGWVVTDSGRFQVRDVQKQSGTILHIGLVAEGHLEAGQDASAEVDSGHRAAVALNHSATHLLHAALRKVLGGHVAQRGSLVQADRLRFDFAHFEPISKQQLGEIERLVNQQIRVNHTVQTELMSLDQARASGAVALFDEKYGEQVRVLSMGDFSRELCGGTHVSAVGDIGFFKITAESGIAAGVRRVEAITGERAVDWAEQAELRIQRFSELLKASPDDAETKLHQLLERSRQMERELQRLQQKLAASSAGDLSSQAVRVEDVQVLAARVEQVDMNTLRSTLDQMKSKLGSAVILLASVQDDKVSLVAGVTKDLTSRFKAGDLVREAAAMVGGKGGGRPDMAQAGGSRPEQLPDALAMVRGWVEQRMSA